MAYDYDKPVLSVPIPLLRRSRGLGDVVAGVTRAVGIQPCPPCKRRQALLNRLVQLRALQRRQ